MSGVDVVGRARPRWLTMGEAARLLGVDASTLRGWADRGKIPVFRTPGGHRRFDPMDLEALLGRTSPRHHDAFKVLSLPEGPGTPETPRQWLASRPWYGGIDEPARARVRACCSDLMQILASYMADEPARPHHLAGARRVGAVMGREVAGWGLTPAQSTEVFLHFKRHVTEALAAPPQGALGQIRSLRDADAFLGEVLQTMLEAYDEG
jgi:excisionase family DNA binding protein